MSTSIETVYTTTCDRCGWSHRSTERAGPPDPHGVDESWSGVRFRRVGEGQRETFYDLCCDCTNAVVAVLQRRV